MTHRGLGGFVTLVALAAAPPIWADELPPPNAVVFTESDLLDRLVIYQPDRARTRSAKGRGELWLDDGSRWPVSIVSTRKRGTWRYSVKPLPGVVGLRVNAAFATSEARDQLLGDVNIRRLVRRADGSNLRRSFQRGAIGKPITAPISAGWNDDRSAAVLTHANGDRIVAFEDRVVYETSAGSILMNIGDDGLPSRLVGESGALSFGNWTDNSVDLGYALADGTVQTIRAVSVDPTTLAHLRSVAAAATAAKPKFLGIDFSPLNRLKIAGALLDAALCIDAIGATFLTAGALSPTLLACAPVVLNVIDAFTEDEVTEIGIFATGTFSNAIQCGTLPIDPKDPHRWGACLQLVANTGLFIADNRESIVNSGELAEQVAVAQIQATESASGPLTLTSALPSSSANLPLALAVDQQHLFWVEGGGTSLPLRAYRLPKGGGQRVLLWTAPELPLQNPYGSTIALGAQYIYLADVGRGKIWRIPKSGGDGVVLSDGQSTPQCIVTDGDYVYWHRTPSSTIQRVPNLGGPTTHVASTGALVGQEGMKIDATHVYWTDLLNGAIRRNLKDGTGTVETLYGNASSAPYDLVLDNVAGNVFFSDSDLDAIVRVAKTGGSGTVVANVPDLVRLSGVDSGYAYFTYLYYGGIGRVSLGTGSWNGYPYSVGTAVYLTTDGTYLYWLDESMPARIRRVAK